MPVDVRGYAFQDNAFPADSTADQYFTESQFESYCRLGEFIGDRATADQSLERRFWRSCVRLLLKSIVPGE
jgi:hypothetical protein